MNLYKVYFKNRAPYIVKAKCDIDAALKVSMLHGINMNLFCYATIVPKQDVWGDAA